MYTYYYYIYTYIYNPSVRQTVHRLLKLVDFLRDLHKLNATWNFKPQMVESVIASLADDQDPIPPE